jgi:hypothetical protein
LRISASISASVFSARHVSGDIVVSSVIGRAAPGCGRFLRLDWFLRHAQNPPEKRSPEQAREENADALVWRLCPRGSAHRAPEVAEVDLGIFHFWHMKYPL